MRNFRFTKNPRAGVLTILAAGLGLLVMAAGAQAVTPAEADMAFNALNKTYWDGDAKFFRKEEQGSAKADFWFAAQLWDTVMDQYDRTHSPEVKRQIDEVYDGFVAKYPDWTKNKYNDDIMWWTIACARAYVITGNDRYLQKAKNSFDFVYDNFTDDTFGGGVYWLNQRTSKNSCVNCPAVIAAARLSVLLKDSAYLEKARKIYAWEKKTLTDGTGKVFDSIGKRRQATRVGRGSLTYNQGTYIGAAVLLYQQTREQSYLDDAIKTAEWTRDNLCVTDQRILRNEGEGDAGAFKGIFVRYMKLLINEGGRSEFLPWMKANADAAWRNRRAGDNIMGGDWTRPPRSKVQSQTAGSAVAVVLCFADDQVPNEAESHSKIGIDWRQGYGFQFWRCTHNSFRGDGAGGQLMVVIAEKDTVVAITADTGSFQAEMNAIWDHLYPAFQDKALPEDAAGDAKIKDAVSRLEAHPKKAP
ncbi:MAG TPA: glycoside hydrolase family 76 protein [Tepidisphaeraceae bacterium]|jgi:predicted alpha-1,6-mannanase (GH76 family)|nr:glycoside hydrolase family 76 protein [Tepidisphaeraceae bacterium]